MSERNNHISRESSLRRRKTAYHFRRRSKALVADHFNAELKQVLGFTLKTNCSFSCDPISGLLAYPAGCVIVLYYPKQDRQTHIFNPGQKTITCLRFSSDGSFIVTGEAGHQPCVRVFSVQDRCQIVDFSSHKFGISSVAFSPNGKYVVSVGFQHDNVINVWDWKKSKLAASNKVSTKIKSIAFAEDSSHFITVGNRHVKFWYLEDPSTDKTTIPLKGRSAILESLRNHVFCDVVCGVECKSRFSFAITRSGILCQFNAGRTVEKFVELKCSNARSLCAIRGLILCGCSSGSVHVFEAESLEFMTEIIPVEQLRGNEIIAISIDVHNMWMHCVFDDHSFVVYNIVNLSSPTIEFMFQFHNACVWDVKCFPWSCDYLPFTKDCFITCSNDGSARVWRFDENRFKLLKIIKLHKGKSEASSKLEARSLSIRSDGCNLAIGDRSGNIHVYDLTTFERIAFESTHEGDVLSLDFSPDRDMLASSSRDRCVHIFDASYHPTHTIADHSAAVTAVKFARHDDEFRLVTCGADKSLYFCSIASGGAKAEISREQHFVERHSMSDMTVLDDTVLVACGCNLSEYDIACGKLRRTFRGNESSAPIVRVAVNSHRSLIAASCTDKNIYILGFTTTDCLCVLSGHSEMAVALAFDFDNRLLSASADSCLFVWALVHRLPDEAKSVQSQTSAANSNASTPDSPEPNRKVCFVESLPTIEQIDDDFATPRSLNGESIATVVTPENDSKEDVKADSFQAATVPRIADTNFSELPTWVTKVLPVDSDAISGQTPRLPLGKWGHKLEADKICEELGNLPVTGDVSSIMSSIDDDEAYEDDSSQTAVEDEVASGSNLGHANDEGFSQLPSTNDDDVQSSEHSTLINESLDAEMSQSGNDVKDLEQPEPLSVEEVNHVTTPTQPQPDIACSKEASKPPEADIPLVENRVQSSIGDEIPSASATATENSVPALTDSAQTLTRINTGIVSPISSSRSTSTEEATPRYDAILTSVSEEDIDLRRVHYQRKAEELTPFRSNPPVSEGHSLYSTPKSHFTAVANINLTSNPQSCRSESRTSVKITEGETRASEQAVDVASKQLVSHVLTLVQDSPIDEENVIETSNDDDSNQALPVKLRSQNVAPQVSAVNGNDRVVSSDLKKQETIESEADKDETPPNEDSHRDKAETEATRNSSLKSRYSNENSTSMPPAFAELLARLSKKGNNPRIHPARKSTVPRSETGLAIRQTDQTLTSRFQAKTTANEVTDVERNAPDSHAHSSSSHPETCSSSHDQVDECERASDDLMNAFSCAEMVYQKHKARHDSEGLANGSLAGLNKLSRSFQKIYSRLSQIKGISNTVHPDPHPTRSVSLCNLENDSPVFSLLREYSDKLVGIVHNHHVDSNLLPAPTDTV